MSSSDTIPIARCSIPAGYTHSQQVCSFSSVSLPTLFTELLARERSPIELKRITQYWCTEPFPKLEIYRLLEAQNPTSSQVLALNILACQPSPDDLEILWRVFIESRFGIRAEDPDIFTRALRILIDMEEKYPQSQLRIWEEELPSLLLHAVQHRDQTKLDLLPLTHLLHGYYQRHLRDGIIGFDSEGGSLFQDIIAHAEKGDLSIPILPEHQPGQYQSIPETEFYPAPITKYSSSWTIPIFVWSILLFSLSMLFIRFSYKKFAGLILASALLCVAESICAYWEIPTRAEQAPLFSFIDFSFAPYQKHKRGSADWWISEGGPSRWQEIPDQENIFRIAVLGASSAHASNLLQEESFSAILENTLQQEFPENAIQVVNMGIGGTISNGILSSGKQAIEMGADAIIVYYGHNEVAQFLQLNHFGATSNINWRLLFANSHLYGLLNMLLPPPSSSTNIESTHTTTKSPTQVREWAFQNHYQNIHALLRLCSHKNVPVLQITPTYNFRFAPATPDEKIQDTEKILGLLEQAKASRPTDIQKAQQLLEYVQQEAQPGSAVYLEALQILAELLSEQKQHTEARKVYQKRFDHALEVTTIHSRIKDNILLLAKKHGTSHLDAEEVFYHFSPDGISANGLFWDELHPSKKGHRYLAQAIIPWAREQTANFLEKAPNP